MNMQQFADLKVGDKIDNHASKSQGTVTEITNHGVKVRWGDGTPGKTVDFTYTAQSTAWFHWAKTVQHASSCAVHNGPALPVGPCDCGAETGAMDAN